MLYAQYLVRSSRGKYKENLEKISVKTVSYKRFYVESSKTAENIPFCSKIDSCRMSMDCFPPEY